MNLDESIEEKEKNEENKEEKQNDQNDHEKKTKEDKEQDQQEMSIDAGVPDLENEAKESDKEGEEIEVEDKSKSDYRKIVKNKLGDLKYKAYTEEFDEIVKARDLENERLGRLRKI